MGSQNNFESHGIETPVVDSKRIEGQSLVPRRNHLVGLKEG